MCCGKDTKTIALVAGILGIIQSFIGIVMSSVNINRFFYSGVTAPIVLQVLTFPETIKIHLVLYLLLQIVWFLSSVGLILANQRDHTCGIRQWIIPTSFVIIAEAIFPATILTVTLPNVTDGLIYQTVRDYTSSGRPYYYSFYYIDGFMNSYLTLVFTFGKAGLITLVTNIVMCVYVGRRVQNISSTSTGHVVSPNAIPFTVIVPSQVVSQPMQPYYPAQAQLPQQPYIPANTQAVFPGQQQTFYNVQQHGAYQAFPYQAPQQVPFQQPPAYYANTEQEHSQAQAPAAPPADY